MVYRDAAKLAGLEDSQGAAVAQAVVMHEIGHLVGLGHVDDASQVMFPGGGGAQEVTDFEAGDRAGLALLGRGPCQPGV